MPNLRFGTSQDPAKGSVQPGPDASSALFTGPGTLIDTDTVIQGSITAKNPIAIQGQVTGDVTCEEDVKVFGRLEGNLSARRVYLFGATVLGDVTSRESILVADSDVSVTGNLFAGNVTVNGQVTGNITCQAGVELLSDAVVDGDISTGAISMEKGASFSGQVKIIG